MTPPGSSWISEAAVSNVNAAFEDLIDRVRTWAHGEDNIRAAIRNRLARPNRSPRR